LVLKSHKVTFVHDWLYYIAGAEQVFFDLIHDQIRRDEASPHPKTNSGHPKTNSGHPNVDSNRPQNAINQSQIQYKIYTMFSNKHFLSLSADRHDINDIKIPIVTALPRRVFAVFVFFDQHKIPFLSKLLDYRNLMFFYPLLIRILRQKIKKYTPNEIHISSFAVAKNVADNCKL
jgi:hypothetical protein